MLAVGTAPAAAAQAPAPAANGWGVPLTDISPDPSILYGRLANGMRYAIRRNATPKGTASVRLHFGFGSIAESDRERGLAHFIEHMAFNGTTNVAEGEMIKMLERQGMAFGPDTNASTGFDATTYMLDLPKVDEERVDTAMFLLRETASEIDFDPEAVNRERGVILGERRARDNYQLRQITDMLAFQYPETPYPERLPIGTEEVLKTASADTLKDLYRRYYRPENATLVFVGDADPKWIEQKIRKTFSDWKAIGTAGAPLPRGRVDLVRKTEFDSFVDPAVPNGVDITIARPWIDPPDSIAERRRKIVESIAAGMFNRRIQKLANAPGSSIFAGGVYIDETEDAARITSVKLTAKDGAWADALRMAEQEVRRALEHGFTENELKVQLANTRSGFRTAAEQADTRTNAALAGAILQIVDEHEFVTTPKYRLERFEEMAGSLTAQQVSAVFRDLWKGSEPLVHVSAKENVAPAEVADVFRGSRLARVDPPQDSAAAAFAYDSFGAEGRIAADTRIEDLGLRTIRFANNVKLNIKKTDFEAGRVRFVVRMGSGQLDLPLDKPGLSSMMSYTAGLGAVKKHSLEDLRELMAGKVVSMGWSVGDDAFVAAGTTTPADLGTQMKVSAAYLLDPGFRPEAESQWANGLPVFDKQLDAQPQGVAQARLPIALTGDARFGIPAASVLSQRSFAEAAAALAPVIADAPIEVTIVGDVDEGAAIAAVAHSFGALPPRKAEAEPPAAARQAAFLPGRTDVTLRHDGPADQALVQTVWPTDDDSDYRRTVALRLLSNALELMLMEKIREELGDSYGVSVQSVASATYTDFGYLSAASVVAPGRLDEVAAAMAAAAAELRDKPISADVLARARNPELEGIDRSRLNNGFWLAALSQAQSEPERLDRIRTQRAVTEAVSPAELQALARQYLTPANLRTARILSRKVETAAR